MSFISNMKNKMTGGWANITISAPEGARGSVLPVTVTVSMKDQGIKIDRVYLKILCTESVYISDYKISIGEESKTVDIDKKTSLFEHENNISGAQELNGKETYTFESPVNIPSDIPPTFKGTNCRIVWAVYAGLDMKGNDPDSGWVEINVK
jgi:hypothetical protein